MESVKCVTDRSELYAENNLINVFNDCYDQSLIFDDFDDEVRYFNDVMEHSVNHLVKNKNIFVQYSTAWYNHGLSDLKQERGCAEMRTGILNDSEPEESI